MPSVVDRHPPSRAAGLARLAAFVPRAGAAYAAGRNTDSGPEVAQAVSALSPYIRHRLITEREVVAAVLDAHGRVAAERFIQEVIWRTYWKGWLQMRPEVWTRFQTDRDAARETGGGMARAVQQAETGNTGIEGFDDWAQELVATGYLHNHARMWFASIWIFTLGLPWSLGADFFLRHLLDGDPASNTLSWRWVAGLQTVGKTYLATVQNIERFTDGRFRPTGLATCATPLSEPPLSGARAIMPRPLAKDVTANTGRRSLLLVTADDLNPESLFGPTWRPAGVVVAPGADASSPWPWGDLARQFVGGATADAAERCALVFQCPVTAFDALSAQALLQTATDVGADQIVTADTPVGPIADALDRLQSGLALGGVPLIRVRRSWDERLWPLATKGFFPFKERAPAALAAEGLPV